jgi:hypothetical protein
MRSPARGYGALPGPRRIVPSTSSVLLQLPLCLAPQRTGSRAQAVRTPSRPRSASTGTRTSGTSSARWRRSRSHTPTRTRGLSSCSAGGTIRSSFLRKSLFAGKVEAGGIEPPSADVPPERLQACPAIALRPAAGSQAAYRRASHPLVSRLGRLALPRRLSPFLTPLPDPRAEIGATRCLS